MADEAKKSADSGATKRAVIIAAGVILGFLSILYHTDAKAWLCENAWFHSALVDGPAMALVIVGVLELRHSGKANEERRKANAFRDDANALRNEANRFRDEANDLRRQNLRLTEQVGFEQNRNLKLIAEHTKPAMTKAQRHAEVLRKYMRRMASVSLHGERNAPIPLEIVDVTDDDIVTLFSVAGQNSLRAYYTKVDCGELTVDEMAHGSCPVRINVLKYHGQAVDLGQIAKWEDLNQAATAVPAIEKGPMVWHASYGKGGSAETRTLHVYQSKDGSNRFQLEANPGGTFIGDNVQVSKQCVIHQVEYFAEKFERRGSGSEGVQGGYSLYVS